MNQRVKTFSQKLVGFLSNGIISPKVRSYQSQPKHVWHTLDSEQTIELLDTDRQQGLDEDQIKYRRNIYGENLLPQAKKQAAIVRFFYQFHNVLIYILLAASVITAFLGNLIDTGVILAVVVINALVGFIQEGKAEKALESIREMLSQSASVIRNKLKITVPAETLVPGDVVILRAGDKVPADLRLIRTHSFQVQEAILTGESNPVDKHDQIIEKKYWLSGPKMHGLLWHHGHLWQSKRSRCRYWFKHRDWSYQSTY